MPHNFKVFGESTSNIYTDSQYSSSSERSNGSQPGTPVVSKLMNTALKSASMVTTAFMSVVTQSQSNTVGVQTAQTTIVDYITQGLISFIDTNVGYSFSSTENSTNGDTLNLKVGSTTKNVTITNAANARTAYNVSTQINSKNISDIFETDGTTAKKATKDAKGNEIANYYKDASITADGTGLTFTNGNGETSSVPLTKVIKDVTYPTQAAYVTISGSNLRIYKCPQITYTYLDNSTKSENLPTPISLVQNISAGMIVAADATTANEITYSGRIAAWSQGSYTSYNSLKIFGQTISGDSTKVGPVSGKATISSRSYGSAKYIYTITYAENGSTRTITGEVSATYNGSYLYVPICEGVNVYGNTITQAFGINFGLTITS